MQAFAIRAANYAGAQLTGAVVRLGQLGVPTGAQLALKASVNGQSIQRLFNLDRRTQEGALVKRCSGRLSAPSKQGF